MVPSSTPDATISRSFRTQTLVMLTYLYRQRGFVSSQGYVHSSQTVKGGRCSDILPSA